MIVRELVKRSGIIGKHVCTMAMGDYPGGLAEIVEIFPDPAAPEIPIQVNHPTFGEIGLFEDETVVLMD